MIGALNLLSDDAGSVHASRRGRCSASSARTLRWRSRTRRLFEHEREYTSTLETLAEVAREFGSILNLDELLTRIASLTRRVVDYRTFGILLFNEDTQELEMKAAVRYGDQSHASARRRWASGLVGYAALHKEPVLVSGRVRPIPATSRSWRTSARSSSSRCCSRIAASGCSISRAPELDAFTRRTTFEILTLLASQAAVAIENARLYETIRANEIRLEREIRFAQRVQAALLPTELPKRIKGVDVAARLRAGTRAGRRLLRLPGARTEQPRYRGRRRLGQRACPPRSTARLPASWCARARSAGDTPPIDPVRPACSRR